MNQALEMLQRWEGVDDPPGENRIAEARRDISNLVVELGLASIVIRQMAAAGLLPDHLWGAHEAACAYLTERRTNARDSAGK